MVYRRWLTMRRAKPIAKKTQATSVFRSGGVSSLAFATCYDVLQGLTLESAEWRVPARARIAALENLHYTNVGYEMGNSHDQMGTAKALGQIADPRAGEPLIVALNNPNYGVRQGAAPPTRRRGIRHQGT